MNNLADFLKIIAEPNRLKILCLLKNDKRCVCEIWQALNLPQNLISSHLKILRQAKLIDFKKDGLKVYYFINKQNIKKHKSLLNKLLKSYE